MRSSIVGSDDPEAQAFPAMLKRIAAENTPPKE